VGDAALIEDMPQQAPFAPFHDHVDAGAFFTAKDAHHHGMLQAFADGSLALKAVEEDRIGLHVGVGNLEGESAAIAQIGGLVNGGHAAARNLRVDAVGVDLGPGKKNVVKTHAQRGSSE